MHGCARSRPYLPAPPYRASGEQRKRRLRGSRPVSRKRGGRLRPIELQFSIADPWSRQLFLALARRYGLRPYRYRRQRRTTVMLQAPESFLREIFGRSSRRSTRPWLGTLQR